MLHSFEVGIIMSVVIKTFSTPGGKYVYDRETNSLLSVSDEEFLACQRVETDEAGDGDWKLLKRYTEQGYLKESSLKEIIHPATPFMKYNLNGHMVQLTLQVTCQCNLRCSYCAYSGNYKNQRTHSSKTMSLEVMKKSVDFLMAHSHGVGEVVLGFYGGEPLLEFEKIKDCVEYVKNTYPGKSVKYSMTTNGTIFNDVILGFLEENNFNMPISFDGPRHLHDKNRVYEDGSGSFNDIMHNVMYIKNNYPKLFKNVFFMTVVAPGVDFACVNNFYDAQQILSDNYVMQSTVNHYNSKEKVTYDDLYHTAHTFQQTKVILSAIGLYSKGKISKLYNEGLVNAKRIYESLSKLKMTKKSHPSGPCLPGIKRPFVTIDGSIFPCERINENSSAIKIGHIDTGFDLKKIDEVLNIGLLTERQCKECWSFFHCGLCVVACDIGTCLSGEEKLSHCDYSKKALIDNLVTICVLLESNHRFD